MDRQSDRINGIKKRIGAILLSLVVAASMMPVFAFAEDIQDQDTAVVEAQAEESAELQSKEANQTEAAGAEGSGGTENPADAASGAADSGQSKAESAAAPSEDEENAASEEEEAALTEDEDISGLDLTIPSASLPDQDDLLTQYIENKSGVTIPDTEEAESAGDAQGSRKAKLYSRKAMLTAIEQKLYNEIKAGVTRIADGRSTDSKLTFSLTSAELRACDFDLVLNAIITDMPYEMYWCDKTAGVLHGYMGGTSLAYFSVAKSYRSSAAPKQVAYKDAAGNTQYFSHYQTDPARTQAAADAVNNAKQIVSEYADLSDYEKLDKYREVICGLTDYYFGADVYEDYGDPWQIIYVFDGDPSTKVVCEGYSKALQFLCDVSSFENDSIECYTVSGRLDDPASGPLHMWNILHMDDGNNYIADLTNCDNGMVGAPDYMFLTGYVAGSVDEGYLFYTPSGFVPYFYDADAYSLYYGAELTLCGEDYNLLADKVSHYPAIPATCTKAGKIEYWVKGGLLYSDKFCTHEITEAQTVARALGHSYYNYYNSLDYTTQKCSRCGITRKVSKVVVDLPKVTIKTPSRAKAAFTAKWSKVSAKNRKKITGIEIQYSTTKSFTDKTSVVKTAGKSSKSKKISKLKRKTTYYVRVRSYKWISGKKHVSKWSTVKKVKTK